MIANRINYTEFKEVPSIPDDTFMIHSRQVDDEHPFHLLIGSTVIIDACVMSVVNNNPYTKSINPIRNKRYILSGKIAGYTVDHIWMFSKRGFQDLQVGDSVFITAKLYVYYQNGTSKYGIRFPYKKL